MIKKIVRSIFNRIEPLRKFYFKLSEYKGLINELKPLQKKYKSNKNIPFLLISPDHGNLGDHAIFLSETILLDSMGIEYAEVPRFFLCRIEKYHLLRFFNHKKIFLHGGGYIGSFWEYDDGLAKKIIKSAPKSDIFLFPHTVDYDDSVTGKKAFEELKSICEKHGKCLFCAREKTTYNTLKKSGFNVKLIPDMVFSLNECAETSERHGCLLCLRNDSEKLLSDAQKQTVSNEAHALFGEDVTVTDMCTPYNIPPANRSFELDKKFSEFRNAELVITDRLHGMIFCAVTGTPCIVLNSKSHKVTGCYEWIKHLEYIKFSDSVSNIGKLYGEIPKKEFFYDNSNLKEYYETLKTDIKNILAR